MLSYSVSQTKWRITTEAENSARGSTFVLLWRLSATDLQANLHNRTSFAQVGRRNISAITFEYFYRFPEASMTQDGRKDCRDLHQAAAAETDPGRPTATAIE